MIFYIQSAESQGKQAQVSDDCQGAIDQTRVCSSN